MAQPAEVNAIAEELVGAYQTVADIITRAQTAILTNPARRRTLTSKLRTDVTRALDSVDAQTRAWLLERFPTVYLLGANTTADALGLTVDPFALVHQAALQHLIDDLFTDLLKATRFVRRDVKRFIGETAKLVAEAKLRNGETAVHAGRRLATLIDEHGIKGITYADGSRHAIDEYSAMAIRTKTAVAYNEGTIRAAADAGVAFYETFDGPFCGWAFHDDTDLANGKIVTADDALANPISHPNCRRSFGARPDLDSTEGTPSISDASNADQQAFDIARGVRNPRPPRTARQPRTPRAARA